MGPRRYLVPAPRAPFSLKRLRDPKPARGEQLELLKDINAFMDPGTLTGILGGTGAGKVCWPFAASFATQPQSDLALVSHLEVL
jgi:ABC-type protease/lipase transport system fused ATPase/permease subunit